MQIISKRKIWFIFSGSLVVASIAASLVWGLNFGIDFSGGSLAEFEFSQQRPANDEIKESLKEINLSGLDVAISGEKNVILRFKDTEKRVEMENKLKEKFPDASEVNFESVGPTIGRELKINSVKALVLVIIGIVIYVAWAFRHVSEPIASWKYGVAAVIALIHDVLIVVGVFAILGRFYGVEVGVPFIAALLTILGYSVNDTIVVFDRTRENLAKISGDYDGIVNTSINETIARSINTSFTTFLALTAVYIFGGETTKYFMLALMVGIVVGTYSSIFLASPIMVVWEKFNRK
ncbi:MAG: protein translocase subunit SecF [bacterium]